MSSELVTTALATGAKAGAAGADRKSHTPLPNIKEWLQFSGWLQYLPSFVIAGILTLIGLPFHFIALMPIAWVFYALAILFAARGLFDLAVIKFRLFSLPEPAPVPIAGDALDVIRARRSCRSFQAHPLSKDHRALVEASVAHHTALDCAEALTQGEVRAVYVAAPLRVWPSVNAREFLVVLGPADDDRAAVIEAGRAMQSVVLDLTAAGIATCWIGPGADQRSVEDALGDRFDPTRDQVLCVIAIGYASRYWPLMTRVMKRAMAKRKPLNDLIYDEVPGLPAPLTKKPYKHLKPAFKAVQKAPSSYNGQTTRLILSREDDRLRIARFATEEGSRYSGPMALGIWTANWSRAMHALGHDGRFVLKKNPQPMALGLVRDVDWLPNKPA